MGLTLNASNGVRPLTEAEKAAVRKDLDVVGYVNGSLVSPDGNVVEMGGTATGGPFVALVGNVWDGSNCETTLTGARALTTSAAPKLGLLRVVQDSTGGRTLSLNGSPLAPATAANAVTVYALCQDAAGNLFALKDTSYTAVAGSSVPDTTPPTLVSLTATSSTTIDAVFSEPVTGTVAGWSFSNGSSLTAASRTGDGSNTWTFTVSGGTMASTDTITGSYAPGDTVDLSSPANALASITDRAVTNSIAAGNAETFTGTGVTTTGARIVQTSSPAAGYTVNKGVSGRSLPSGADGTLTIDYLAGDGNACVGLHQSTTPQSYTSFLVGLIIDPATGAITAIDGGVLGGSTVGTVAVGNKLRLRRAVVSGTGTFYLEKSTNSGASWTLLNTYAFTYSTAVYAHCDLYGTGPNYGVFSHPESVGFV